VAKTNAEIAEDALRRARIRFPKSGPRTVWREARRIVKEEKAGSWLLILSMLWPLIVQWWKNRK